MSYCVSLHGGHSGEFCAHARGTLREVVEAAVQRGYHTFGITEHMPRTDAKFLYPEEKERRQTVEDLATTFRAYASECERLRCEFIEDVSLLKGMEIEVVPAQTYAKEVHELRKTYSIDYIVGSVHHVGDYPIDYDERSYSKAIDRFGSLESLAVAYYEQVGDMVSRVKPEVVGHLDLIRKLAPSEESVSSARVRDAARESLKCIRAQGSLLDLNLAGIRKGLRRPYPAPWLVELAQDMGIKFCFGDDSHSPQEVGKDLEEGRIYLTELGVSTITYFSKVGGELVQQSLNSNA